MLNPFRPPGVFTVWYAMSDPQLLTPTSFHLSVLSFRSLPLKGCAHACHRHNQPFWYSNEYRKALFVHVQLTARIHQQTAGMKMASRFFSFFFLTLSKCRFKWIRVRYEEEILRKKKKPNRGSCGAVKTQPNYTNVWAGRKPGFIHSSITSC